MSKFTCFLSRANVSYLTFQGPWRSNGIRPDLFSRWQKTVFFFHNLTTFSSTFFISSVLGFRWIRVNFGTRTNLLFKWGSREQVAVDRGRASRPSNFLLRQQFRCKLTSHQLASTWCSLFFIQWLSGYECTVSKGNLIVFHKSKLIQCGLGLVLSMLWPMKHTGRCFAHLSYCWKHVCMCLQFLGTFRFVYHVCLMCYCKTGFVTLEGRLELFTQCLLSG